VLLEDTRLTGVKVGRRKIDKESITIRDNLIVEAKPEKPQAKKVRRAGIPAAHTPVKTGDEPRKHILDTAAAILLSPAACAQPDPTAKGTFDSIICRIICIIQYLVAAVCALAIVYAE